MKYNININQLVLSETSLDIIDCAILDYIVFYCSSHNKKIDKQRKKENDGDWTWINFNTLLSDMPILRIKSKGALTPRIKKIEEEGYITTKRFDNQKLFIKLNEKVDELFITVNRAVHDGEQIYTKSCSRRRTNNNTITTNNNTIIISEEKPRNETQELLNIFYDNLNPNIKFQNKTLRADAEFLVKKYPLKTLKNMVLYIKEKQGENFFPTVTTPTQLRDKMASIIAYKRKEDNNNVEIVNI